MSKRVIIVNYGIGNIQSVAQAVINCGYNPVLADNEIKVMDADYLILPGVGAFGDAVSELQNRNLFGAVIEFSKTGRPLLGICVGMQMLFEKSYEFGEFSGLGLIPGTVKKINLQEGLRIPNISWQPLKISDDTNHPVLSEVASNDYFYFIHSYAGIPDITDYNLATYQYGKEKICAIVGSENILGTQFHPEKSGKAGLRFLNNWLNTD